MGVELVITKRKGNRRDLDCFAVAVSTQVSSLFLVLFSAPTALEISLNLLIIFVRFW